MTRAVDSQGDGQQQWMASESEVNHDWGGRWQWTTEAGQEGQNGGGASSVQDDHDRKGWRDMEDDRGGVGWPARWRMARTVAGR